MSKLHPTFERVTARIIDRSKDSRAPLSRPDGARTPSGVNRPLCPAPTSPTALPPALDDKAAIKWRAAMNIGIVTAYNDMLSAHQPYGRYPEAMKMFAREVGATAQVAGGTPAMCDGVTQGRTGWSCRCSAAM
jgi:phosphogluconate dehydratase